MKREGRSSTPFPLAWTGKGLPGWAEGEEVSRDWRLMRAGLEEQHLGVVESLPCGEPKKTLPCLPGQA